MILLAWVATIWILILLTILVIEYAGRGEE